MPVILDIEKFINCVRNKPQLWDKLSPMYRHSESSNALWKEVSEEMGGDIEAIDLKSKWRSLRDVFRRELRLINSQETVKKKRKWAYFDQMSFLANHIGHDEKSAPRDEDPGEEILFPPEELFSETESNHNVAQGMIRVKIEPEPHEDNKLHDHWRGSPEDEDYHFAMSILPHMRRVPMSKKLRMRIKISEIIAKESVDNESWT